MAWYPGATKMELQPESDAQPAIRPTQFILHSIAAPWDERRIGEYWDEPGVNLESHFGLGYDGGLAQFIGTETRADANAGANRRSDGTGAVSIETASNLQHTDPWTDAQIRALIELGVWLHRRHGIPLRICRSADDPGYGYHSLHRAWSTSGTACPGAARIRQFHDVVFPGIVRAAEGEPPTPVKKGKLMLVPYTFPAGETTVPIEPPGAGIFKDSGPVIFGATTATAGPADVHVDVHTYDRGWFRWMDLGLRAADPKWERPLPTGTNKIRVVTDRPVTAYIAVKES